MARLDQCLNIRDLRAAAQHRLPKGVFEFVDRATEDHIAVTNNRSAFERIKLRHRALVDVSGRNMATTLFGKPTSLPMAIAPTGAAGLCWHQGEVELARAAAKAQIPLTLSTASMTPMEKIAQVGGRLWFQLYVWKRRDLSHQLIQRAHGNGFEALIVTVDSPVAANREYNTHNGFGLPFSPTPRFTFDIMCHPRWATSVLLKYFTSTGFPRHENYPDDFRKSILSGVGARDSLRADSLDWSDIARFRDMWPGVLMLKGVNRPDDAVKACSYGIDGIVVSNHGGRNMDSAVASLDVLPEIAEAVGQRMTVILDSGVRRGSDIVKALALGAKAVLTGRATLYGTAVGGEAGALKAITILKNEADKTMAYTGCRTVDEITTDIFHQPVDRSWYFSNSRSPAYKPTDNVRADR
jgi:isopentenyl diphosphate isomerase/L-lactate dehydrogenase-like FMN-dependent dehydrogenase